MDLKDTVWGADLFPLLSRHRQALMGFAALAVLALHEYVPLFTPDSIPYKALSHTAGLGFVGVDIFFLLSGMGLTYAIRKPGLGRFYYNRFRRIYFPFFAVGVWRLFAEHWSLPVFLGNISGVRFYTVSIFCLLWFIPAIATLYLFFPPYYALLRRAKSKPAFTALAVALWLALSLLLAKPLCAAGREEYFLFTNRIPIFLLGVLLGWLAQHGVELRLSLPVWLALAVSALVGRELVTRTLYRDLLLIVPESESFLPALMLCLPLVAVLPVLFTYAERCRVGRAVNAIFAFYGKLSLELYCVHEYLGPLIIAPLRGRIPPLLINLAVLAGCTLAALLLHYAGAWFWRLAERPRKAAAPAP